MEINKTFTNKLKPDKDEQDEPIYIIKCIDGKTKAENVLYIDYKSKDARLCGYIPGEPIGNNKVNTAVEACKQYLDIIAKNNTTISLVFETETPCISNELIALLVKS